jgi:class 3 adenylate cyclase/tetratricopeptide (TPR) repeat protein
MNCSRCGYDNPDTARFCGECGTDLPAEAACPSCGAENPLGQRFCNACGHQLVAVEAASAPAQSRPTPNVRAYTPAHLADKITASAGSLEGERKQVTVLFADVQGSMDLAESVDTEVWRSVIDRFFSLICEGVHRFEGTVNKFTGDGAMALFGAPIAHEDHARRACYAALYLRDELARYAGEVRRECGLNFSVRMGLNSGEVVVGGVGDNLHMDYTAIGHTVGLASRMEALAEPGRPYLTADTASLVEGYFELEDLGRFEVQGVHEPVQAYALTGTGPARTRLEAAGTSGLSRFVGRQEELAALEGALAHADRGGQVVGVVAEPGLGKSRLCLEFTERWRSEGLQVTVGRGLAHGKRIPLLPVIEMLRGYFGITEQDDPRAAREKMAGRLLLLDDAFRDALPFVFDFLGVPDPDRRPAQINAEARQRQLFAAIRRLVHAGSAQNRGIILVEDLHWLDPGSEAFLENLVESLPGTRTLLVVNFRPEYRAVWMQKSYYQQLALQPLGGEAIQELLGDLLGEDPSLDGLGELIEERTGGNPFFIEEVVQGMVDSGSLGGRRGAYRLAHSVSELTIPPTVQAVLAARIDRLPEREKRVLQTAAVIGKDFAEPVLRLVTGLPEHELREALGVLSAAEFIFERSLYPEAEYSFKHPLTEEVAYRSQLGERRARAHAAVAQAIAEVYPDRLDELAALLANHWEQGGDPLQAAQWSARAAWWAGQNHPAESLRHWRRVRATLRGQRDSPEAVAMTLAASTWILHLGWRLGLDDDEVAEVFAEGMELARESDDKRTMSAVQGAYGIARGMVGDVREALAVIEEARELAQQAGDAELTAATSNAYWLSLAGRPGEALVDIDETLERSGADPTIGRTVLGFSMFIWAVGFRAGTILPELGRAMDAGPGLDRALELAREHGDVESLGWTHSTYAFLAWFTGDEEEGVAHGRQGVEIAERLGSSFSQIVAYLGLGQAHVVREEWNEASGAAEQALEIIRETRTGLQYGSSSLSILALAQLGRGEGELAASTARRGVDLAVSQGLLGYECRCRVALAQALTAQTSQGAHATAREELGRALTLVAETGAVGLEPHVRHALAALAWTEGDRAQAVLEFEDAQRLFTEHGATRRAEDAAAELATVSGSTR